MTPVELDNNLWTLNRIQDVMSDARNKKFYLRSKHGGVSLDDGALKAILDYYKSNSAPRGDVRRHMLRSAYAEKILQNWKL